MASTSTPWIGARGAYELKLPWKALDSTEYVCTAIVTIATMLERNVDVFAELYEANELSEVEYRRDLEAGVNIIALSSTTAPTIYVPDSYIVSYPDVGLVNYSHIVLSASLGAVPDDLDLSFLQEQVTGTIKDVLGVDADILIHKAPAEKTISPSEHEALELARVNAITVRTTDRGRAKAAEDQVKSLTQKVAELERIIIENNMTTS